VALMRHVLRGSYLAGGRWSSCQVWGCEEVPRPNPALERDAADRRAPQLGRYCDTRSQVILLDVAKEAMIQP
jgi:hypothetical protein